jgi:Na+/H+ antiporter NhaD/arsenite permease-like protein
LRQSSGSAAFATPFGYQTNVIVYQVVGYRYLDFVRVGLPLNLVTYTVAIVAITFSFPFRAQYRTALFAADMKARPNLSHSRATNR